MLQTQRATQDKQKQLAENNYVVTMQKHGPFTLRKVPINIIFGLYQPLKYIEASEYRKYGTKIAQRGKVKPQ